MPDLPGNVPWSSSEICALRDPGVALPEVSDQLDQAAKEWVRPVMATREQLLLVLPPPSEEVHPLWQMICAVVEQPRVMRLEELLESGGNALAAVTPVPLAAAKRWWKLPEEITVPLREKESFSSLELLLFNPYQWLLRYRRARRPDQRSCTLDESSSGHPRKKRSSDGGCQGAESSRNKRSFADRSGSTPSFP
jgi:hypothetical protein